MPFSPTPARFSETARAGTRLPMTLAIVLKGTDAAGNSFTEDTRTVVINRSGAKILTSRSLSQGMRLQVTAVRLKRESWATLAWLGEKKGPQQEIGIDLDYVGDFWGVQFPEDAGTALERMRGAQAERQAEAAAAGGQASVATTEGGAAAPSSAEPPGPAAAGGLEPVQASGRAAGHRSQMEAVEQAQDLLGRVMESCVKELEERAVEVITRHTHSFEQVLEQLLQQAGQRLADRVAEYEARLERMPKSNRK